MECLINWLEDNPKDHHQLFSDSSQSAREEKQVQQVVKGPKMIFFHKDG